VISSRAGVHYTEQLRPVRHIRRDAAMSSCEWDGRRQMVEGRRRKEIKHAAGGASERAGGLGTAPPTKRIERQQARQPLTVPKQRPTSQQNSCLSTSAHPPATPPLHFYSFPRQANPRTTKMCMLYPALVVRSRTDFEQLSKKSAVRIQQGSTRHELQDSSLWCAPVTNRV
jgi:hypothetical protein